MTPEPAQEPTGTAPNVLRFPTAGNDAADDTTAEPTLRSALGEVLRDERHRQERTLHDVASDAAVSTSHLSDVERGTKEISSDLLEAVARALDVPTAEVLERCARALRTGTQRQRGGVQLRAA